VKRGEIYRASLDPTVGREQQGFRPLLVITNEDFNRLTSLPVILPITNGGAFARRIGYAVPLDGWGLRTTGVVRCDQPRVLDLRGRNAHYVETINSAVLEEILDRVADLFS
jgi:mRNA-degrading endonuclease toxin of MazEF toxin-antitoxin module